MRSPQFSAALNGYDIIFVPHDSQILTVCCSAKVQSSQHKYTMKLEMNFTLSKKIKHCIKLENV